MNYATSRQYRRLVGRLSKGENVIASLERLCKRESIRSASIRAMGLLSKVELQSYNQGAYRTSLDAEGTFEVLNLTGNVSTLGDQTIINCYTHLSTQHLGRTMTFGGRLYEGVALTIEFVVDVYDDILLERRFDARLGLPLLNKVETLAGESSTERATASRSEIAAAATVAEPEPEPEPVQAAAPEAAPEPEPEAPAPSSPEPRAAAFTADGATVTRSSSPQIVRRPGSKTEEPKADAPGPSWADAMQVSQKQKDEKRLGVKSKSRKNEPTRQKAIVSEWPEFPDIKAGDLLKHPSFGLCKILYVEEDDFVRVRRKGGKVVDIKLEVCELTRIDDQDGKRAFQCKIIRR